jgi:hypothetical protein
LWLRLGQLEEAAKKVLKVIGSEVLEKGGETEN